MSACIHCAGRGEVYDNTCGATFRVIGLLVVKDERKESTE